MENDFDTFIIVFTLLFCAFIFFVVMYIMSISNKYYLIKRDFDNLKDKYDRIERENYKLENKITDLSSTIREIDLKIYKIK